MREFMEFKALHTYREVSLREMEQLLNHDLKRLSPSHKCRVACIIALPVGDKYSLRGFGINHNGTIPVEECATCGAPKWKYGKCDICGSEAIKTAVGVVHAEVEAIRDMVDRLEITALDGFVAFVSREPCEDCDEALHHKGLSYYYLDSIKNDFRFRKAEDVREAGTVEAD